MTTREYVYRITEVVKVVDGDSYWLRVDVGFHQSALINVRLLGYDCPERSKGSDRERSEAGRAWQIAQMFLFQGGGKFWVRTEKDPDAFGRWLGDIWAEFVDETLNLGAMLRDEGLASVWPTRWRDEFDRAESPAKHSTTCELLVSNRACTCPVGAA